MYMYKLDILIDTFIFLRRINLQYLVRALRLALSLPNLASFGITSHSFACILRLPEGLGFTQCQNNFSDDS